MGRSVLTYGEQQEREPFFFYCRNGFTDCPHEIHVDTLCTFLVTVVGIHIKFFLFKQKLLANISVSFVFDVCEDIRLHSIFSGS